MESYLENNLLTIPIDITYNNSKKNLKFPKNWSSVKNHEECRELFEKYKFYKGIALLTGEINNITVIDIDNIDSWNSLGIDCPDDCLKVKSNRGIHLYLILHHFYF